MQRFTSITSMPPEAADRGGGSRRRVLPLALALLLCVSALTPATGTVYAVGDSAQKQASSDSAQTSASSDSAQTSASSDSAPAGGITLGPPLPDLSAWNLVLVNATHELPKDHSIKLSYVDAIHAVDKRCYTQLQAMLRDCRAAGHSPAVCSAFRTQSFQASLLENEVATFLAQGYSQEDAEAAAARQVAVPGTSEHQLGLAVDIVDTGHWTLDKQQAGTPTQKWLMKHCWDYGFILRYPVEKRDITGIIFEPWHYRYVGKQAAREIRDSGLCLEEYIAWYQAATLTRTRAAAGIQRFLGLRIDDDTSED